MPGRPGTAPLAVAVLGDSTAAGYGAQTQEYAMAGLLARGLVARTGRSVDWIAVGRFGATARRIRHRLLPTWLGHADIVVLMMGSNDVLAGRAVDEWVDDLTAVLDTASQQADRVVLTGVAPFAVFPGMPRALGRHLGARARMFNDASRALCATRPSTSWLDVDQTVMSERRFYAGDSFHPSPAGYARWADAVADLVAPAFAIGETGSPRS